MKKSLLIILLILSGFLLSVVISKYFTADQEATRKLNDVLTSLMGESDVDYVGFSSRYLPVLSKNKYRKITDWSFETQYSDEIDSVVIKVNAKTLSVFGGSNINLWFAMKKNSIGWQVDDSKNFLVVENQSGLSDRKSFELLAESKEKLKIEKLKFSSSYGDAVSGSGVVNNQSDIPFKFVKLKLEYLNKSGGVVNTDDTYLIGGNELFPGQKRKFEWHTSNCEDCETVSYYIDYD